jgi:subtilisin family serine protease
VRNPIRPWLAAAVVITLAPAATLAAGTTAGAAPTPGQPTVAVQPAPSAPGFSAIKGRYVVELKPGSAIAGLTRSLQVTPRAEYRAAITGFTADLTPAQLGALQRDPSVVAISEDVYMAKVVDATQVNPPSWGIDRIDQRNLPLSRSFTYNRTGSGVHAYIIDTGIDPTHPNFGGRATFDRNTIGGPNTDCNGHGTHVAGTVGSASYGVAKSVRLHGVKWLNCSGGGTLSSAVNAVNWVTANRIRPAVANASWNYTANSTLETALRNMINSGVFLAASAGNTGANSCDRLPRKIETALVTASSTITDARSSFSSTGPCVDIYAPGSSIVSTYLNGGSATLSGTSMATPHVTGTAALYLQTSTGASPATVKSYIESRATPNVISGGGTGGTVNRLLFTNNL